MTVKPFHFKLKRIDPAQQRVLEALFEFLPRTGQRDNFNAAIREALSKHLNVQATHRLEAVTQEKLGNFCKKLPAPALVMVLDMPPREKKILVDVDTNLAAFFIDRLLGGDLESFPIPKELSDIEQGVLQYLTLQILAHIYRLCGQDSRVHFRFEKFIFKAEELLDVIATEDTAFVLTVKLTIGKNDGFVRLALPSPLIEELYLNVEAKGETREAERKYLFNQLREFDHIKTSLWGEAGSSTLSVEDLKNLEAGDVIIFDQSNLKLDNTHLTGQVILRAGNGRHGGFVSEVEVDTKKVKCRLVDIHKGEDIL